MPGGLNEVVRRFRAAAVLSEADWDELANLGIRDVIFVPTPNSSFVSPVVLMTDESGLVHSWVLAERPSEHSARAAVAFFLECLAGLRRLTGQKFPWAPGVADEDQKAERAVARSKALSAAIDEWYERVNSGLAMGRLADDRAARDEERRRKAAAGAPIREARKRWKLTQAGLAEKAKVKVAALSEIERGLRAPNDGERARLAEALDARPEDLFGGYPGLSSDPKP